MIKEEGREGRKGRKGMGGKEGAGLQCSICSITIGCLLSTMLLLINCYILNMDPYPGVLDWCIEPYVMS